MTYDNLVQHIPTSSHALRAMNEGCSSVHQELLLGMWDGHCMGRIMLGRPMCMRPLWTQYLVLGAIIFTESRELTAGPEKLSVVIHSLSLDTVYSSGNFSLLRPVHQG